MTVFSRVMPPKNIPARLIYFSILFCIIMLLTLFSMRAYTLIRSFYLRTDFPSESVAINSIKKHYPFISFPENDQWLLNHFEPGQSLYQYTNHTLSDPLAADAKIYLMKLVGDKHIDERLFELTREYLELYFCMPSQFLSLKKRLTLPEDAIRMHPETGIQISADYLLHRVLIPVRPENAAGLIALTAEDLWPGNDWNFVFGKASRYERVGVWSIARLQETMDSESLSPTLLRRTLKTASHEFGHMLGMRHCITYQCNMNGSNHLEEADSQPLTLCPHCLQKLLIHKQCNLKERLKSLHAFLHEHGIDENAQTHLEAVLQSFPDLNQGLHHDPY